MRVKRFFDFTVSSILLIFCLPLMLSIAILVKIKLGSPIFFTQERVGKGNKVFKIIKFRTMTNEKSKDGMLLSDHERLTKFGKIIRSLSLDELPELLNVIKGDMSIVGPRPLPTKYLPYYSKEQLKRHTVNPGITGWAQINGRNLISWKQKFILDLWYIQNMSLLLDLKIIIITFFKVIKREGITQNENEIMETFNGSN